MKILIAGAGEVGFHLAKMLSHEMQNIIIIDKDTNRLEYIENNIDVKTIKGDATCPDILMDAQVNKTDLLVAVTASEANNLAICAIGKKLGAKRTISRISNTAFLENRHQINFAEIGIDSMISPSELASKEIERLIEQSAFTDHFVFDNGLLHLVGIHLDHDSQIVGKIVSETKAANPDNHFIPVAISRNAVTIIPRGSTRFMDNDFVYFISKPSGLSQIISLTGKKPYDAKSVMILGGSSIGLNAAKKLVNKYSVKIIEKDNNKCFDITEQINNVLVICGDGRNLELLQEENIENTDVFISVTGNTETNIMSCLVAKAQGVKKTIALVENMDYIQFSQMVGIDTMINKKLIAASNIFRHVREGKVLSLASLHGVDAEVLEFEVKPGSKITRKAIKDLNFPKAAIIGGVVRKEKAYITMGDFKVEPEDHVVVFTLPESIQQVERFFK